MRAAASFLAATWAAAAVAWPHLPNRIPIHWNIHGVADGFGSRGWVFASPVAATLVFAILAAVRRAVRKSLRPYGILCAGLMAFFLGLTAVVIAAQLGHHVPVGRLLLVGLGGELIVIGRCLPGIERNPWVGIRTPSTLASDEAWARAQAKGGRIMVILGALVAVAALVALAF